MRWVDLQLTENLKLKKPDLTDYVIVSDLNDNMDVLDREVGELKQGSTTIADLQTENKTLAGAINELERNKADKTYVAEQVENIDVPVKSVNSKTGAVTLSASDVGSSPVGHVHAYGTLTGIPGAFPPSAHAHAYSTLTGIPSTFPPSAHTHTPAQVGLGSVLNYGIATTAEAQAGAVNNKYMTPALTKTAVKHLATTGGISMVKSVQRGYFQISGTGGQLSGQHGINISTVNPLKSLVKLDGYLGTYSDGSDVGYSVLPSVTSFTSNKITLNSYKELGNSHKAGVSWQIIEYY